MKKFISMVMAAAMVVSLVPATAFAYEMESTAKILDVAEMTEAQAKAAKTSGIDSQSVDQPELQIKVTSASISEADKSTTTPATYEFDLKLGKAEWASFTEADEDAVPPVVANVAGLGIKVYDDTTGLEFAGANCSVSFDDVDKDEATVIITMANGYVLDEDDKIVVNLGATKVTKYTAGSSATVTVKSDDLGVKAEDLVFAMVQDNVLEIEADDTTDLAEEEPTVIEDITIEAATGFLPKTTKAYDLKLKLNSGFEFVDASQAVKNSLGTITVDGDEAYIVLANATTDKIVVEGLKIEADTAKVGDVATIKVSASDWDAASCEVATVVAEGLSISVDEDEDVPEMWSGVAVDSSAVLTEEDDNLSLTMTIEESVVGSYNEKETVELVLPEGVIVTDVDVVRNDADSAVWGAEEFAKAYREGDHQNFMFKKRVIDETTTEAYDMDVTFTLIAVPGFVGDVTVEMLVEGESVGEVTIATFKTPVVVEAQQNDMKIDYRNTEVGSDIVVKEAEAGLWKSGLTFEFGIDKFNNGDFEDDAVYTTNEDDSDMTVEGSDKMLKFEIDDESDEVAGEVTISNISLYMERNIPAGAYDLTMTYKGATTGTGAYDFYTEQLFAADCVDITVSGWETATCTCADSWDAVEEEIDVNHPSTCKEECKVVDIYDVNDVVKEGFINVVTAGREQDDASFTTKVVVPVGEAYIVAGENTITLDVPAYVSEAGYTMLPVRAVATALGISNNNVLWDAATKTVTILYGQRIITMQVGSKVINVNGSAIPASASVEIVNGRTFLPMRDLATALGVTDITWDAATKTATLNGNV